METKETYNSLREASKDSIRFEDLYPRDQWENIADKICAYIKDHLVSKKYPNEKYRHLGIEKWVSKEVKKIFDIKDNEDVFTMDKNMDRFKKLLLEKFFPNLVPGIGLDLDDYGLNVPGGIYLDGANGNIYYSDTDLLGFRTTSECIVKRENNDSIDDRNLKHAGKRFGYDEKIATCILPDFYREYDEIYHKAPITQFFTPKEIESLANKIYGALEKRNNLKWWQEIILDGKFSKINDMSQLKEQIDSIIPTMEIGEKKTIKIGDNEIIFWISYEGCHVRVNEYRIDL